MKLRGRLLVLIGLLLVGSLAATFLGTSLDLEQSMLAQIEQNLKVAEATFRRAEQRRFENLGVIASWLEESSDLRTLIRHTDRATLDDYLFSLAESSGFQMMLVTNPRGKILARVDGGEQAPENLEWVLEGYSVRDYWSLDSGFFQVVSVPLVKGGGAIEATITVGYAMDREQALNLARDLGGEVAFSAGEQTVSSVAGTFPGENPESFRTLSLPLGPDPENVRGQLQIALSVAPAQSLLERTRARLALVAGIAFILAFLVSFPLVGRMTNPVALLEAAEREMSAIFAANLDGLVALDSSGRVSTSNPAAAAALGVESDAMVGRPLKELLPAQALDNLSNQSGGLSQQAEFEREGRQYELRRRFFRTQDRDEPRSILLIHELTTERKAQLEQLLAQLMGAGEVSLAEVASEPMLKELGNELDLELELGEDLPAIEVDRGLFELALRRLALGAEKLTAARDGGSLRLTLAGVRRPTDLLGEQLLRGQGARPESDGDSLSWTHPAC